MSIVSKTNVYALSKSEIRNRIDGYLELYKDKFDDIDVEMANIKELRNWLVSNLPFIYEYRQKKKVRFYLDYNDNIEDINDDFIEYMDSQ